MKDFNWFSLVSISVVCIFNTVERSQQTGTSLGHYENIPIQIYWKFYHQKRKFSDKKNSDILHNYAQNIDCWYSLEPPRRGGSNESPQSMFLSRNKKINVYPCKPQFYYIKVGFKGVKLYRHVFVMVYTDSEGPNERILFKAFTVRLLIQSFCERTSRQLLVKCIPKH